MYRGSVTRSLTRHAARWSAQASSHSTLSASLPRRLVDSTGIIRFYYRLNRQSFRLMVLSRQLFVVSGLAGGAWRGAVGLHGWSSVPRADENVTAMRLLHDAGRRADSAGSRRVNRTCSVACIYVQSVRRLPFRLDLLLYSSASTTLVRLFAARTRSPTY